MFADSDTIVRMPIVNPNEVRGESQEIELIEFESEINVANPSVAIINGYITNISKSIGIPV